MSNSVNTTNACIRNIKHDESIESEMEKIKGKSWHTVEEERRKTSGRKSLSRVIFTSSILDGKCHHDIGQSLQELTNAFMTNHSLAGGIVLISDEKDNVCPSCVFGFLELDTSSDTAQFLETLHEEQSNVGLETTRILMASHDCPCHDFGSFNIYSTTSNSRLDDDDFLTSKNETDLFRDMMTNLCMNNKDLYVSSTDDDTSTRSTEIPFKILTDQHGKCIPSAKQVSTYIENEEYPSLEEYIDIFHSPIHVELDSENISPIMPDIDWDFVKSTMEKYCTVDEVL